VILTYILRLILYWCTHTAKDFSINQFVIFYLVLFYFILHYSIVFSPILWFIPKKFLIQSLTLLFRFSV